MTHEDTPPPPQTTPAEQLREYHPTCAKCDYNLTDIDPSGTCPECGTPIINGCIRCEYDLTATDPSSNCPECGVPVVCSIGHSALGPVPTETLRAVHTGFRLVTTLILISIITGIASTVTLSMVIGRNPELYYPVSAVGAIINNGLTFGIVVGWFKLTKPLTGLPDILDAPDKRSFVRVTLWIYAACLAVTTIWQLIPQDPYANDDPSIMDIVVGIFFLATYVVMLVVFISNVLYLGWFARLVQNRKMTKRSKHFAWSGPVIAILGLPLLFIGPLITLILYWNMVEYIRRDLKKIINARAAT